MPLTAVVASIRAHIVSLAAESFSFRLRGILTVTHLEVAMFFIAVHRPSKVALCAFESFPSRHGFTYERFACSEYDDVLSL